MAPNKKDATDSVSGIIGTRGSGQDSGEAPLASGRGRGRMVNYTLCVTPGSAKVPTQIRLAARWTVPPETLFGIFTHPKNARIYRDTKAVTDWRVLSAGPPGLKVVSIEKLEEVEVLGVKRSLSTLLKVTEDCRDADRPSVVFTMERSEAHKRFEGGWTWDAVRDPATGAVIGCEGLLLQDVLPKGVPRLVQKMPGFKHVLRCTSGRAARRMIEDTNVAVAALVTLRAERGLSLAQALDTLCSGGQYPGAAVGSHQIAGSSSVSASESDEENVV
ncbi:hypothetical protein FOA52_001231 [Chlamydomonas sp. UWO 241]|nr:hypothetical protein FOA52_001231 [Chlamydomonas sp. UWO 241]